MGKPPELDTILRKAFTTAILLTGSVEQAEAAVLEGARLFDPVCEPGEALLSQTVIASIELRQELQAASEQCESLSPILPKELRSVMRLSHEIRQCFVLRHLVGWLREICAYSLRLEIGQIDEHTRNAMQRLARLGE